MIAEITLRLRRPPPPTTTMVATFASLESAGTASAAISATTESRLLELMDRAVLHAVEAYRPQGLDRAAEAMLIVQTDARAAEEAARVQDACERAGATLVAVSDDEVQDRSMMAARRLAYDAVEKIGRVLVDDISVPLPELPRMLRRVQEVGAAHSRSPFCGTPPPRSVTCRSRRRPGAAIRCTAWRSACIRAVCCASGDRSRQVPMPRPPSYSCGCTLESASGPREGLRLSRIAVRVPRPLTVFQPVMRTPVKEGGLMSNPNEPRRDINLEQQRKRAKELRRAHGERSVEAALRIVRHFPRARGQDAAQVLAAPFTLSDAQLVVAREAGFASWPDLRHHVERSQLGVDGDLEAVLSAAIVGDTPAVRAALAARPELPRRSIHLAAALGDEAAALGLLDERPSLATERGGQRQWTPLYTCCSSRHGRGDMSIVAARTRIAARLLTLGANPNDEVESYEAPGGFRCALQGAARDVASAELVAVLLDARASLLQTYGAAGPPIPLTDAVAGGDLACLERLLASGPKLWEAREALEVAVFHDRPDMAARLIEHGAQPDFAGRWWGNGGSCLHGAILLRRERSLLDVLLSSGVDLSKRDHDGRTAYAVAVRTGHDVAAELLRRRGAGDAEVGNVDRVIAACLRLAAEDARRLVAAAPDLATHYRPSDHLMIGWAIRNGRSAAVPLLLEAGLDPNLVDADGNTALHVATAAGDQDATAALLAAGASRTARNYLGRTPLGGGIPADEQRERDELFERAADAVAFGDLETLRELLETEPDLVHWRSPRVHRATLLLYCGANGTEAPRQRTPANAPAVAQLLVDRGADPNAAGNFYGGGRGATTLAMLLTSVFPIEAGVDADLVRVLVRAGARLDLWPDGGPMVWAINRGRYESARALAEAGVAVDNLFFAAGLNRVDVLEALLARGANVNTRHWSGATALHAAASMGHQEATTFLLERGADPTLRETSWNSTAAGMARWLEHDEIVQLIEDW